MTLFFLFLFSSMGRETDRDREQQKTHTRGVPQLWKEAQCGKKKKKKKKKEKRKKPKLLSHLKWGEKKT